MNKLISMTQDEQKRAAAQAAIQHIPAGCIVGVGTGSTANYFIDELARLKHKGEGALTREKIVAAVAKKFIGIADQSKLVKVLGKFPLPVEVIPMARSYVARELVKLGGQPRLREGFTTDNGNLILDVHGLSIIDPVSLETAINHIIGVVTNGLFARRGADVLLLGTPGGVKVYKK